MTLPVVTEQGSAGLMYVRLACCSAAALQGEERGKTLLNSMAQTGLAKGVDTVATQHTQALGRIGQGANRTHTHTHTFR